jgi:hypothetical protein
VSATLKNGVIFSQPVNHIPGTRFNPHCHLEMPDSARSTFVCAVESVSPRQTSPVLKAS